MPEVQPAVCGGPNSAARRVASAESRDESERSANAKGSFSASASVAATPSAAFANSTATDSYGRAEATRAASAISGDAIWAGNG